MFKLLKQEIAKQQVNFTLRSPSCHGMSRIGKHLNSVVPDRGSSQLPDQISRVLQLFRRRAEHLEMNVIIRESMNQEKLFLLEPFHIPDCAVFITINVVARQLHVSLSVNSIYTTISHSKHLP